MRQTEGEASRPVARGVLRPKEAQKAFRLKLYPAHPELRFWPSTWAGTTWATSAGA